MLQAPCLSDRSDVSILFARQRHRKLEAYATIRKLEAYATWIGPLLDPRMCMCRSVGTDAGTATSVSSPIAMT